LMEKPDCTQCRKLRRLYNEEPPCKKCLPQILPENQPVIKLYFLIQNQHIMGPAGPVDLNVDAAYRIIDRHIENKHDQEICFDMIYKTYHEVLRSRSNKNG